MEILPDKTDSLDDLLCGLNCGGDTVHNGNSIVKVVLKKYFQFIIAAHEGVPFGRGYFGFFVDVGIPKDAWLHNALLGCFIAVLSQPLDAVLWYVTARPWDVRRQRKGTADVCLYPQSSSYWLAIFTVTTYAGTEQTRSRPFYTHDN